MSSDSELTGWETRIGAGCSSLAGGCWAWITAADTDLAGWPRVGAFIGRSIGGVVAGGFVGGILTAFGTWGWAGGGGLLALSVWVAGRPDTAEDPEEDVDLEAFLELVHDVADGGNVHLRTIREQLAEETGREWSGPQARALCDAAGIPVRDGVRVPGASPAVTTGIHRADLPPLPHPLPEGVWGDEEADQDTNNNTNGDLTRTEVGQAAVIVKHGPDIWQGAAR